MRILVAIGGIAALLTVVCAERPPASQAGSAQDEKRRVQAAEDEYVAAEINSDEAALRRLVDDRFVFNSADGRTLGKEDLIQSVLAMNMTGQTITERTVTIEGDVAIIFGTTELRLHASDADERVSKLRYTAAYVKRHDQWRMLALQMVPRSEGED